MKFKSVSLYVFLPLILAYNSLQAYVYRIEAFRGQNKNIYLLSDYHEHTKDTQNQVEETINQAKSLKSPVIVENYDHNFIKSNSLDEKDIKSCYLGLLSYKCIENKVKSSDIDFRGNLGLFLSENDLKLKVLLEDYKKALEEVSKYNDSPILNNFYKETCKSIKENIDCLEQHKECNFKNCCRNKLFLKEAKNYSDAIKSNPKQLTFDCVLYIVWGLLEAKILHEIHNSKNENIFVCVGGYHNATLEQIFTEKLGYKKIHSYGSSHENENPKAINIKKTFEKIQIKQSYDNLPNEINFKSSILIIILTYLMMLLSKTNLIYIRRKKA